MNGRGQSGADLIGEHLSLEELRRGNAELIAQVAQLNEAVAARDTFLAVAAHELQNSITPIVGRVQMLRHAAGKPEYRAERLVESLDQIQWLITHYLKRSTTLLDVSRITSGRMRLSQGPVEAHTVVREVVENYRPLAQLSSAELALDLTSEEFCISGDRLALEEILDNLVSNAIKYGGKTSILVSAGADVERNVALFQVRDGGAGISSDNQARIFERFERAVRPGEHRSGFGVGLWLVQQLTEAMNGTVTVTSAPGAGATFCVTLPLQSSKGAP